MTPGQIEYEHGVAIPGVILSESEWARTAIKRLPEEGPLVWPAIFGRDRPVVLELGCGNGRFTLASALDRPELNHFAIDLLPVVIRYATRRANQRGLHHVRFAVKDGQTFLARYVAPSSVAEIHVYHPQPYHDSNQASLRLVSPGLLAAVHRALGPHGRFFIQTDNPDYWQYMTRVVPAFFEFDIHTGPWPETPLERSRREILARQRGLAIYRGTGRRRDDIDRATVLARAESLPQPNFRSRGPWCELDRQDRESGSA